MAVVEHKRYSPLHALKLSGMLAIALACGRDTRVQVTNPELYDAPRANPTPIEAVVASTPPPSESVIDHQAASQGDVPLFINYCGQEENLPSRNTASTTLFTFVNDKGETVRVNYVDNQGNRQYLWDLLPGQERSGRTAPTQLWVITQENTQGEEECVVATYPQDGERSTLRLASQFLAPPEVVVESPPDSISPPIVSRPPQPIETQPPAQKKPEQQPANPETRAFPEEIILGGGEIVVHNIGTGFGVSVRDGGFRDANGNFCPDGYRGGECRGYTSGLKQENIAYLNEVVAKYGAGRSLKIFIHDVKPENISSEGKIYPTYALYGEIRGGSMELNYVINENIQQIDFASIIAGKIWAFLAAYPYMEKERFEGYMLRNNPSTTGRLPIPLEMARDLTGIGAPLKFTLIVGAK